MIVGGIFGPKKSGKTTLARALAESYWQKEDRASLVFDPNLDSWPACCWCPPFAGDFEKMEANFWQTVWTTKHKLIICDDAAKTVNRNPELNDLFTRINHNGHKLLIIGHSGTNLLPIHRQQMDVIYLFRSTEEAGRWWYDVFGYEEILTCNKLQRYEFMHVEQYAPVKKHILKLGA